MGCNVQKQKSPSKAEKSPVPSPTQGFDLMINFISLKHDIQNEESKISNQNKSLRSRRLLEVREVILGSKKNLSRNSKGISRACSQDKI